jgi:hypothetical protein
MRDRASDTSASIAPAPSGSSADLLETATHNVVTMRQQPAVVAKRNRQHAMSGDHEPSLALRAVEHQAEAPATDVSHSDRSQHTLDLLRELARKITDHDRTQSIQAARPDPALPWHGTLVAMIAEWVDRSADAPRTTARERTGRPAALFAIVACLALLAAAGLTAFLWSRTPVHRSEPPAKTAVPVVAPSKPAVVPAELARPDIVSIQKAMAECELEASKNPFTLYFLVIPVVLGNDARQSPEQFEENYGSYSLMSAKTMLDGLRDRSLTLTPASFRYAIIDSATGNMKGWSAATGVSKFTHDSTATYSKFRVAIDVSGKDPKWSNEFSRRTGVCYWINVRFPQTAVRRP